MFVVFVSFWNLSEEHVGGFPAISMLVALKMKET
jgi:hypothetical protein